MNKTIFQPLSVLLIVFLILPSCKKKITTESDSDGNTVITEWYNKNQAKSIKIILDENARDYIFVHYDKEGNMLDSAKYVNDTLDGTRQFYEEKTTLFHTENYQHGLLNGAHKAVYQTGITGFEGYRKNNLMVDEWQFHFADGHPITYEYYDSTGVLKYFRKYDNQGNVLKVEGLGMIRVQTDLIQLDSTQTLSGFVEAAIPPECTTRFTIENVRSGQSSEKLFEMKLEKPATNWEITFTEPGQKNLKFTVTITDGKTGKKEESISEQTIMVNPVN